MTESNDQPGGIYRFTSIARPVDPSFPTNRALLFVLPALALINTALSVAGVVDMKPVSAALSAALVGFASWALTRELAPDDDAAAFLALAFSWLSSVLFDSTSVLLLFAALFLVRVVNRSTGIPARPLDTIMVLGLTAWSVHSLQQPLLLIVASFAFALDAFLRDGLKLHVAAAVVSVAGFGWFVLVDDRAMLSGDLVFADWLMLGALLAASIIVVWHSGDPESECDVSPARLNRGRVAAGLFVGFLVAFQALLTQGQSAWLASPIWVCIVAVPVAYAVQSVRRQHRMS